MPDAHPNDAEPNDAEPNDAGTNGAGTNGAGPTDDLFRALADPTRRGILDLLADRGTLTVSELAAHFPDLVASGISKHLMALRATGLVTATRQGRNQLYAIDAEAMSRALAPWLARYEAYWTGALTRLRQVATDADEQKPD